MSGPDGVWSCSLAEHDEAERPRWHVGIAGVYTSTALRFSRGVRADQTRDAVVASAGYAPTSRLTLQASAGAAFGGQLRAPNGTHEFSAGPTVALGATYRVLEGDGLPFIALSGLLSASWARTQLRGQTDDTAYSAFDLRLGVVVGTTLFRVLSPYAVARVFGGPVLWHYENRRTTGTDASHYQLGVGLSWLIAERIDLFVEGIPLGERALSGGVAAIF